MTDQPSRDSLQKAEGFTGKKILVIDDNEFVCEMISKALAKYLDLEVFKVRNGRQAIAAALTGRYDGAIIDLALPGMSINKVIRTIKTMLPKFPIVAMSAHQADGQVASLQRYGIIRILHKPFKIASLIEEMTDMLRTDNALSTQNNENYGGVSV